MDNTLVDLFNIHITYVHSARSEKQFKEVLLPLMLEHWIELDEENMADVMEKVNRGPIGMSHRPILQDLHRTIM